MLKAFLSILVYVPSNFLDRVFGTDQESEPYNRMDSTEALNTFVFVALLIFDFHTLFREFIAPHAGPIRRSMS